MITALSTIKNWFKTGEKPTEKEFGDTWDSFWHKSEKIPKSTVAKSIKDDFGLFLFTLKQSGSNPPVMTVLHDDFNYDPMWLFLYLGKGNYLIGSDNHVSPFADFSFFYASQPEKDTTAVRIKKFEDNTIQILTSENGTPTDGLLDGTVLFEIRMMPGWYGYEGN